MFNPFLGTWSSLTHVFQMGWFNLLETCWDQKPKSAAGLWTIISPQTITPPQIRSDFQGDEGVGIGWIGWIGVGGSWRVPEIFTSWGCISFGLRAFPGGWSLGFLRHCGYHVRGDHHATLCAFQSHTGAVRFVSPKKKHRRFRTSQKRFLGAGFTRCFFFYPDLLGKWSIVSDLRIFFKWVG